MQADVILDEGSMLLILIASNILHFDHNPELAGMFLI